jgi:hypothetical protein
MEIEIALNYGCGMDGKSIATYHSTVYFKLICIIRIKHAVEPGSVDQIYFKEHKESSSCVFRIVGHVESSTRFSPEKDNRELCNLIIYFHDGTNEC